MHSNRNAHRRRRPLLLMALFLVVSIGIAALSINRWQTHTQPDSSARLTARLHDEQAGSALDAQLLRFRTSRQAQVILSDMTLEEKNRTDVHRPLPHGGCCTESR